MKIRFLLRYKQRLRPISDLINTTVEKSLDNLRLYIPRNNLS